MPTAPLADLFAEMEATMLAVVAPAVPDEIEVQVVGGYRNPNPTPPSIDMYPGDPFREYPGIAGFQEVGGEELITVRVRTGTVDNVAGQLLLLRFMDDVDPISVAATLMDDQTLNGLASSVYVDANSGSQVYEDLGGAGVFIGCEWRVRVLRVLS